MGFIQVFITTGTKEEAKQIINSLVRDRLIACGQVTGPIESTYWWQGTIENSQEWLCIVKSKEEKFKGIVNLVKQIHSYEVPEIIACPLTALEENYARWLEEQLN